MIDPKVISLHTDLASVYRQQVEKLSAALNEPDLRLEAIQILRQIIDRITIYPSEKRGKLTVKMYGQIANFFDPTDAKSVTDSLWVRKVVAAEGFEPPTKGL